MSELLSGTLHELEADSIILKTIEHGLVTLTNLDPAIRIETGMTVQGDWVVMPDRGTVFKCKHYGKAEA